MFHNEYSLLPVSAAAQQPVILFATSAFLHCEVFLAAAAREAIHHGISVDA
jgi:hypothetical protein